MHHQCLELLHNHEASSTTSHAAIAAAAAAAAAVGPTNSKPSKLPACTKPHWHCQKSHHRWKRRRRREGGNGAKADSQQHTTSLFFFPQNTGRRMCALPLPLSFSQKKLQYPDKNNAFSSSFLLPSSSHGSKNDVSDGPSNRVKFHKNIHKIFATFLPTSTENQISWLLKKSPS